MLNPSFVNWSWNCRLKLTIPLLLSRYWNAAAKDLFSSCRLITRRPSQRPVAIVCAFPFLSSSPHKNDSSQFRILRPVHYQMWKTGTYDPVATSLKRLEDEEKLQQFFHNFVKEENDIFPRGFHCYHLVRITSSYLISRDEYIYHLVRLPVRS